MEYFVTGSTGLTGSHVVHTLVDDGHDVIALTRSKHNTSHLPDGITVVEGDVTAKETMRGPMTGVDGVFHIAAWTCVRPGPRNVETAEQVNVDGTRNVFELLDELGIPKGVYTSSVGIYGNPGTDPIDESYQSDGQLPSVYQRTKWRAHYGVVEPMMEDGVPILTVQPAGVFGRWDKPSGSVRSSIRDYLQGDLPLIPRGFNRPWEHAADTARSHIPAMEHGDSGEEYIIARGDSTSIVEVFQLAEEIPGCLHRGAVILACSVCYLELWLSPNTWQHPPKPSRPERLRVLAGTNVVVDNSKAKRELGIDHRPLEEGLREYIDWEKEQLRGQE